MGTIKHSFTNLKADGTDNTIVRPSNWNANHDTTGTFPPDPHGHIEDDVTNLITDLSLKETPSGAQAKVDAHAGASDPHIEYQKESEKGAVSGYAGLDVNSKVPTAQLGGVGADSTKFLRGDQTWQVPSGGSLPTPIHIDLLLSTGITVTNAAIAGSEPPTFTCRRKVDLTNAAQFRGEFISSLTVATIQLRLQYSTNQSVWNDLGTNISAVTTANGLTVGTWENIPAGAKADVFIRPLVVGNGALDPVIRLLSIQIK